MSTITAADWSNLDYDGKVELLERVVGEMLEVRIEYASLSGRVAELRANLEVLKQVKGALQSAIRAEREG